MALSFTSRVDGVIGSKRVVEAVVAFDDSYPLGGEAFTALTSIGLKQVDSIAVPSHKLNGEAVSNTQARTGVSLQAVLTDKLAPKLKVYVSSGAEAADEADLTGLEIVVWFFGS